MKEETLYTAENVQYQFMVIKRTGGLYFSRGIFVIILHKKYEMVDGVFKVTGYNDVNEVFTKFPTLDTAIKYINKHL